MKIEYNGFAIEFGINDIKEGLNILISLLKGSITRFNTNKIHDFNVALIDKRYELNGYIISYGVIRTSAKKLKEILDKLELTSGTFMLEDIFNEKILIKNSGELNGYEPDTPELSDMDIVIRFYY